MENEIKVGEYGRTNLGNIIKFAWFQNNETGETYRNKVILVDKMTTEIYPFYYFKKDEYIVKHSSNLIDLIQCGDYVNGSKVLDVMEDMKTGEVHLEMTMNYTNEELGDCTIYNKDIKTIVTKEMMESISYKAKM